MAEVDPHFYDRADALIELATAQLAGAPRSAVGDSFLYAVTRFNAWAMACGQGSAEEMRAAKAELAAQLVERYRQVLEANLDDYVTHFDQYTRR